MNQVAMRDNTAEPEGVTLKYGNIPLQGEKRLNLIHGLPGFEHLSAFVLAELEDYAPFCALVSEDEPEISMLIINLQFLSISNNVRVPGREWDAVVANNKDAREIWAILKTDHQSGEFLANVKAPLIVNTEQGIAKQIILDSEDLVVDYPLSEGLL